MELWLQGPRKESAASGMLRMKTFLSLQHHCPGVGSALELHPWAPGNSGSLPLPVGP